MDEPEWGFVHADGLLPGLVASAVGYASAGISQSIHRGLPSPYVTFIITFDNPVIGGFSLDQATGPQAIGADVIASGLHTGPAYIRQPRMQSGIQLALHPLAARKVLGLPPAELARTMVGGDAIFGAELDRVRDQLASQQDWNARFAVLQGFLRKRADSAEAFAVRPEVAEAWRWLVRHRGTGTVSGLADHVCLSQRQLHTLFAREFGVGPKAFNRLVRFQRALRMITGPVHRGARPDLADVASAAGFADQSHLNRDFVAFAGLSPTRWLAEEFGNIRSGGHRNGDDL